VLRALDQTRLPAAEVELELGDGAAVAQAIHRLAIRGAPLIGVAAAYGLAMEVAGQPTPDHARAAAAVLRSARPTAVNLSYAVDRVLDAALAALPGELAAASLAEARRLHEDELAASAAMARHGADFLGGGVRRILTHCNTGVLAAPGYGTALGVIAELHGRGSLVGVLATESRPLLQGARLTVWELSRLGIPHELCVDSAAAGLLAGGAADAVILGCDRVAASGDVANKVGTYMLALAARAAGIPFVVAGPRSTIDPRCADGASIVIEERDPDEVRTVRGQWITLPDTAVRNPAFDVTPASLVSALVTERGVVSPVDGAGIRELLAAA
jgi:methylthioribose-1-phosphate isomerase